MGSGPCGFQEWLSGVSASTRMKIEQGGSKALQTKIHVSCQEEKVLQGMSSVFWGSGRWGWTWGLNWMFKVPSSTKQPIVLGEQVCAEGTWLCYTGNLGRWGRTSGLVEREDLKAGEWKMQWDEHHQSQE